MAEVSRYGVVPYAASLDHVGIFAKDIKTVATMLVIAGYDRLDQAIVIKKLSATVILIVMLTMPRSQF